jgi:hypothetical protein
MAGRAESLGEAAWELLRRLVRERIAGRPGGHLIESRLEALELRVSLALSGPDADPRLFSSRLVAAIDALLDEAVEQAAAFRPGRAWCHRCESAGCEHGAPPSCRHVLIGYAPTGVPRWEDFGQHCLELGHPRVDELYLDPPALVTLLRPGKELEGSMLAAFRNGRYEVLGQLLVGFYTVRARAEDGRGVLALTVQVAGSFSRGTRPRLGLNLLGRGPDGGDLEALLDRYHELPWRRSLRWAQTALETLVPSNGSRPRSAAGIERRVLGILEGLGRRLEREHRSRGRRTRHAEERHRSGQRPTRKALDDARAARDEDLWLDGRSGTLVVIGERGRTHFFGKEGQHVSSVRYSREAIARKLEHEQWIRPSREQIATLRESLDSSTTSK